MWRDLRFAVRALVRQPFLTAVVVGTVALGIGGSTAVFTVLNAVLIRELPYPNGDRLYVMRALAADGLPGNITRREFAQIYERENHPTVETAAIVWSQDSQLVGSDKRGHPAVRYGVTDRFFEVFATPMALGRGFEPNENPGRIVITHRAWRDVFGSDPDIVGKSVSAEGMNLQVMGVTAPAFEFPEDPGFFYLMRIGAAFDNVRAYRGFMRLREGRSHEDIQRDLTRLASEVGPDPVTAQRPVFVAEPFLEYVVGDLKSTVLILFGATAILLLIACINVTNLLLSRTTVRSREVALREAVGAGRWRIVRQLLTESLVLTAVGGALGLAMGVAGVRTFLAIAPTGLPRLSDVPIDNSVLWFAFGATIATGVLVGLAPAARLARNQLRTLINEGGRGAPGGPTQHRVFGVLVVTEIALAVVLVIGAGLLIRSYYNLTTTDPGFSTERVLTISMNVPGRTEFSVTRTAQGPPQVRASYQPMGAYFRDLQDRLRGLAGVQAVATTTLLPLAPDQTIVPMVFTLPGQATESADAAWTAPLSSVSPPFFGAMGMRLVEGRWLEWSDRQGAPGVAVVNETFARRFFGGTRPLGGRIRWRVNRFVPTDTGFQFGHLSVDEVEVVGIVADAKYVSLARPAEPAIYVSSEQFINRRRTVVVRTSLDAPDSLVPAIRRELNAIDPQVGAEFAVYDSIVEASIARERLGMALLVTFGVTALLLAAVGVYGLMSYSVAQRTGEMAVRSALGSSAGQVMALVMRRGLRLAVAGVVIGVIGAIGLRRVLASQLYDVSPLDPSVLFAVTALLFAVATLACFIPARRATRVDPADLLRSE
jgi:predicted permease